MPAPAHPRSHRLRAAFCCGVLALAGVAACLTPVHLDPAGAGSTGSGGAATTGGDAGACHSNVDCTYPLALCDTVSGSCVGCLTAADCTSMPGAVCSMGQCTCVGGADTACNDAGTAGSGGGGGGGGGQDAGADAGQDAGVDAGPCVTSCQQTLTMGGPLCAGSMGTAENKALKACAGCSGGTSIVCAAKCAGNYCADQLYDGACLSCIENNCATQLANCSAD